MLLQICLCVVFWLFVSSRLCCRKHRRHVIDSDSDSEDLKESKAYQKRVIIPGMVLAAKDNRGKEYVKAAKETQRQPKGKGSAQPANKKSKTEGSPAQGVCKEPAPLPKFTADQFAASVNALTTSLCQTRQCLNEITPAKAPALASAPSPAPAKASTSEPAPAPALALAKASTSEPASAMQAKQNVPFPVLEANKGKQYWQAQLEKAAKMVADGYALEFEAEQQLSLIEIAEGVSTTAEGASFDDLD